MVDTTTPDSGVDSGSDEAAMASLMSRFAAPEEPAEQPQESASPETAQPSTDPVSEELTVEDIPDDPAPTQSAVEAFEIVHNGQQHSLSREDTIKYAQQGFDYTQKTQQLAEKSRQVDVLLQRAQEVEQMTPLVAQDLALVKSFESQLQQYQNVNWVDIATREPLEYPKYRAQYDQLVASYNTARDALQRRSNEVNQRRTQITAENLRQEAGRLTELIPEFRDPAKAQKITGDIRSYLTSRGVPEQMLNGINQAALVAVAYDGLRYAQLSKAKAEKVKQLRTAPPVTRPQASQPGTAQADQNRDLMGRFRKSGDVRDAAAVLLNRWK